MRSEGSKREEGKERCHMIKVREGRQKGIKNGERRIHYYKENMATATTETKTRKEKTKTGIKEGSGKVMRAEVMRKW